VFFAAFIHDLLTPINIVRGLTEEAKQHVKDEQAKSYLKDSLNQLSLLEWHCDNIIDVSKHEISDLHTSTQSFELDLALEEVFSLCDRSIKLKNLEKRVDIDSRVPRVITSDRQRLQRIVAIMLGNALKHTNKGFIQLKVKLERYKGSVIFGNN